ncbi:hypothetical protein SGPA1_12490 [Streptomyces misionensis JCM 4497]
MTQTARWSLVIGPVDRCKGPSRENEQANTQRRSRLPGGPRTGQNEAGHPAGPASPPPRPGSLVWIRPDQGAGSGACRCKAEEGVNAERWRLTTTRQMCVPDPASPAGSRREALRCAP